MKKLIILFFLAGCATTAPPVPPKVVPQKDYSKELKELDYRILYTEYDAKMDKCFTDLDICRLKGLAENICWAMHERCVIEGTKRFKMILKTRGHE